MKNGFYIALGIRKKRFEPLSTKMFRQLAYVVATKIAMILLREMVVIFRCLTKRLKLQS